MTIPYFGHIKDVHGFWSIWSFSVIRCSWNGRSTKLMELVSNKHLSSISWMKYRYVGSKYMHFMTANSLRPWGANNLPIYVLWSNFMMLEGSTILDLWEFKVQCMASHWQYYYHKNLWRRKAHWSSHSCTLGWAQDFQDYTFSGQPSIMQASSYAIIHVIHIFIILRLVPMRLDGSLAKYLWG
jgi:hypothetical protein